MGDWPPRGSHTLVDRANERRSFDQLVSAVRSGQSRVLVLSGEAGVGKTALLTYLNERAAEWRVLRAEGVQSEMEMAFAGLHQLLAPMLDRAASLPTPQRNALRTAFGISDGPVPDRFLVGVAVLGLLAETAGDKPLVCLVDDAQWLDKASAQVLGFVARRLAADPVALVFGTRDLSAELAGLPTMVVVGLQPGHARALLQSVMPGALDARVRDQIVAETRGNPLALLELTRGLSAARLAGGFGLPGTGSLEGRIEESFRVHLDALPMQTRRFLLIAAADPTGDPSLVRRAGEWMGIPVQASAPAVEAGLAEFGARIRFRHPLIRSAAYRSASTPERQEAHRALAEVTDPAADPERRAWHRAHAAAAPDEDVAAELERSAGRAKARGGLAAAAAFLERSVILTPALLPRAGRALAGAQASVQAGALAAVPDLLAVAEAAPLSELQQAYADLVRAQLAFATHRGSDAPPLLLKAAKRLESEDVSLSRASYMDALIAAVFAGRLAGPGGSLLDVARAAGAAPPASSPRVADILLDGLAAHFNQGFAAAAPVLRNALRSFDSGIATDMEPRWLSLAFVAAEHIWDDEATIALSEQWTALCRRSGALSELPLALFSRVYAHIIAGELAAATSVVEEMQAAVDATGTEIAPFGALGLAAMRGDEADTSALTEATLRHATLDGQGLGISAAGWAAAVLNNGLGRYEVAFVEAQRSTEIDYELGFANWAMVELIEAAVRNGTNGAAADAFRRLSEQAEAVGTDWVLGLKARSQALLSEGAEAERLYREAIERLTHTRARADLARSHLLYGEYLRRERRSGAAREQLRTACQMLDEMGMAAFAERARRERRATGDAVATRVVQITSGGAALTTQEDQIARLARDGLSNPEIAERLFISVRTVQYHLSKVFAKLDIRSRAELYRALPTDQDLDRHAARSALARKT
ncbi:MAG: AAA family ATPase [Actinobacteria bacterium]|nr:AAA family ATPase [Actinomycetota bacterium]